MVTAAFAICGDRPIPGRKNVMRIEFSTRFLLILLLILLTDRVSTSSAKQGRLEANAQQNGTTPKPLSNEMALREVRRDQLLNGLQLVSLEKPAEGMVQCDIVIRAGSMFDPVAKTGLAGLTQRTLLAVNPRLQEEMESLGATIEWGWNWDTTWFRLRSSPRTFEQALEILARLLVVDTIRPDAFKLAVEQQLSEIRRPLPLNLRADELLVSNIFGTHPYGHNLLGTDASLSNLRPGDVYDYFRRFYIANNASAIVTGPIRQGRVVGLFKIFFGGWSKGEIVPATFRRPVGVSKERIITMVEEGESSVEVRVGLAGERAASPAYLAARALGEVWGLRWQKGEESSGAREVRVDLLPRTLDGPFYFRAEAPTHRARAVANRMTEIMTGVLSTPITPEELESAKTSLASSLEARPLNEWLWEVEAFGLPRNWPLTALPQVRALTVSDVSSVARTLLERNSPTVVLAGRLEGETPSTP
jgi:zinc protease